MEFRGSGDCDGGGWTGYNGWELEGRWWSGGGRRYGGDREGIGRDRSRVEEENEVTEGKEKEGGRIEVV